MRQEQERIAQAMREFVQERNDALLSLDKKKILAYCKKYGVVLPTDDEMFWAGVHNARILIEALPEDAREFSRRWLAERGFKSASGWEAAP